MSTKNIRQAGGGRTGRSTWVLPAAAAVAGVLILVATIARIGGASAGTIRFTDVEKQTREFMAYERSIVLTPEQERVKEEALSAIPAPCCSDRTAATCCCQCNMAKSWWGLAKHLIANEGKGVDEVRAGVEEWLRFINPDGFSGNACYTGGCGRAFRHNGCGGMDSSRVVF